MEQGESCSDTAFQYLVRPLRVTHRARELERSYKHCVERCRVAKPGFGGASRQFCCNQVDEFSDPESEHLTRLLRMAGNLSRQRGYETARAGVVTMAGTQVGANPDFRVVPAREHGLHRLLSPVVRFDQGRP